jgi:hypothetical protein
MAGDRREPDDPLAFIQRCVGARRLYWSYHVNMRMRERFIPRERILDAVATYEIIESYPRDKYLPSYLVRAAAGGRVFHVLFATDVVGDNVRVVTAYSPDPSEWTDDFRTRRKP